MSGRAAQGAGSIRKKTVTRNGKEYTYWEARYTAGYDPGTGKQIQKSISGKTQKEVRQKLQQVVTDIDQGTYVEPSKVTVEQWLNTWLNDFCVNVKPRTLDKYRSTVSVRIIPHLGRIKLTDLTTQHIQRVYNCFLRGEQGFTQLSTKSIRDTHGTLHRALQQAVELDYIKINPADRCKLPRVEKTEIKPLESEKITTFLQSIKGSRFERLFSVDLFSGMRMGEILALSWDCIDFEQGIIHIYRQLHQVKGKYMFGTLKNDKPRTLAVAPFVLNVLKEQWTQQRCWKIAAGAIWENHENLVFTDEIGRHLCPNTVRAELHRFTAPLGLDGFRFHDLRHSYAVASIQAGDDIKTLQSNLGHHTAAFTMEVYGHCTEEMQRKSASRMEQYIQEIASSN